MDAIAEQRGEVERVPGCCFRFHHRGQGSCLWSQLLLAPIPSPVRLALPLRADHHEGTDLGGRVHVRIAVDLGEGAQVILVLERLRSEGACVHHLDVRPVPVEIELVSLAGGMTADEAEQPEVPFGVSRHEIEALLEGPLRGPRDIAVDDTAVHEEDAGTADPAILWIDTK